MKENNLFIEQAYFLLTKGEKDQAFQILLERAKKEKGDIKQCLDLAIQFNFIQDFFQSLVESANQNTASLNILLEYIDYIDQSKEIINQYQPGVQIGDIKT